MTGKHRRQSGKLGAGAGALDQRWGNKGWRRTQTLAIATSHHHPRDKEQGEEMVLLEPTVSQSYEGEAAQWESKSWETQVPPEAQPGAGKEQGRNTANSLFWPSDFLPVHLIGKPYPKPAGKETRVIQSAEVQLLGYRVGQRKTGGVRGVSRGKNNQPPALVAITVIQFRPWREIVYKDRLLTRAWESGTQ